jgi:hypothetical protein
MLSEKLIATVDDLLKKTTQRGKPLINRKEIDGSTHQGNHDIEEISPF